MYNSFKISALLLMGGEGARFESSLPKQFHNISGKKVYLHTLDLFLSIDEIDEIILVCHKDWLKDVNQDIFSYPKVIAIEGGNSRQSSSFEGLKKVSGDFVIIHDAVRPFVTKEIVLNNIKLAIVHKAVDTCIPSADTLVNTQSSNVIHSIPNRSNFLRGQTPQTFQYDLIFNAHKKALEKNIQNCSDDCSLVLDEAKVHVVMGDEHNIKITSQLDLFIAEQLFRIKKQALVPKETSLKNKKFALVGASGGIGSAILQRLKEEGAIVIPISRTSLYKADITNFDNLSSVFEKIYQEYQEIDGLINAAGIFKIKSFQKFSKEEIQELVNVNLTGLIYTCLLAKIKDEGHVINISSSAFYRGRKEQCIYSATKAAVVNFTQGLAEEFPKLKINAVLPSRTNTLMRTKNLPNENPKSLLDPKEIANTIVDLLKDNHITGSIIEVRNR
ncbi:MAG: bifunctional cytidylyltransferase/SDR family oxidoreductase [Chlamydiae bacterium]|nr:bifunctional cytidylyltransferase/SDR family oxidoreductase [Chlamydiota bacterium]